jgi:hypothetical protein
MPSRSWFDHSAAFLKYLTSALQGFEALLDDSVVARFRFRRWQKGQATTGRSQDESQHPNILRHQYHI